MKPFNLEEAKAGKPVVTRDGRDVRILAFDYKTETNFYPLIGLVTLSNGTEKLEIWTNEGRSWCSDGKADFDLFIKTEKKQGWVNLYRDAFGSISADVVYRNEVTAKSLSKVGVEAITTIKVEWEE